jgi:hypothetical protein
MAKPKWEKLDDVSKSIAAEPWSLYWTEWKSGTKEFEEFLHDPVSHFAKSFKGVKKSWNVQTHIIGHEAGMMRSAVCSLALVDHDRKTVFMTLYKHTPK